MPVEFFECNNNNKTTWSCTQSIGGLQGMWVVHQQRHFRNRKQAGDVAQLVGCLLSVNQTLSLTLSTAWTLCGGTNLWFQLKGQKFKVIFCNTGVWGPVTIKPNQTKPPKYKAQNRTQGSSGDSKPSFCISLSLFIVCVQFLKHHQIPFWVPSHPTPPLFFVSSFLCSWDSLSHFVSSVSFLFFSPFQPIWGSWALILRVTHVQVWPCLLTPL